MQRNSFDTLTAKNNIQNLIDDISHDQAKLDNINMNQTLGEFLMHGNLTTSEGEKNFHMSNAEYAMHLNNPMMKDQTPNYNTVGELDNSIEYVQTRPLNNSKTRPVTATQG